MEENIQDENMQSNTQEYITMQINAEECHALALAILCYKQYVKINGLLQCVHDVVILNNFAGKMENTIAMHTDNIETKEER